MSAGCIRFQPGGIRFRPGCIRLRRVVFLFLLPPRFLHNFFSLLRIARCVAVRVGKGAGTAWRSDAGIAFVGRGAGRVLLVAAGV